MEQQNEILPIQPTGDRGEFTNGYFPFLKSWNRLIGDNPGEYR
jgi:hypothetical protein